MTLIEPTGGESLVYATVGETPFVARVKDARGLRLGESVSLSLDVSHCHFFDPATQLRIGS